MSVREAESIAQTAMNREEINAPFAVRPFERDGERPEDVDTMVGSGCGSIGS